MLAKVISYAPNRTDAASKLAKALQSAHIGGVKTNRDFLINCLQSKEFIDGDTTSDFIEKVNPSRKLEINESQIEHVTAIAAMWIQEQNRNNSNVANFMPSGWTNGRLPNQKIAFEFDNKEFIVEYKKDRDGKFIFASSKDCLLYTSPSPRDLP